MKLIDDLCLGDLRFKGQMHTWSNNRVGEARVMERLDRVLNNGAWQVRFHKAQCIHDLAIGSDHTPIHLSLDHTENRSDKSFKFEEMWYEYPEYQSVIRDSWSIGGVILGAEEYNGKLKACRT